LVGFVIETMSDTQTLTTAQAEAVVDELIETYGLGAYPKVTVHEISPGRWRVEWRSMNIETAAMTATEWTEWLRRRVGSISPEKLTTTAG
jgi:hypothetical protein